MLINVSVNGWITSSNRIVSAATLQKTIRKFVIYMSQVGDTGLERGPSPSEKTHFLEDGNAPSDALTVDDPQLQLLDKSVGRR